MTIYRGDARHLPPQIEDHSVACVVTSPPYPRQRVYDPAFPETGEIDPAEIGQAESIDAFCTELLMVGAELRRVLRPDGTWWLNLSARSSASGGAGGDYGPGGRYEGRPKYGRFYDAAFAPGQMIDVAAEVAVALRMDGWRLRMTVIWDKGGRGERQSPAHVKRPLLTHESILMLVPSDGEKRRVATRYYPEHATDPDMLGSVWHFAPGGDLHAKEQGHHAPFPIELPRRCILLSTQPGDLVLDPFSGSGTTLRAAEQLGRVGIGVDLYANEGAPTAPSAAPDEPPAVIVAPTPQEAVVASELCPESGHVAYELIVREDRLTGDRIERPLHGKTDDAPLLRARENKAWLCPCGALVPWPDGRATRLIPEHFEGPNLEGDEDGRAGDLVGA